MGTRKRVFGEPPTRWVPEVCDEKAIVRKVEISGDVKNPHDPDAQWACKDTAKKTAWVGYKAQIAETVSEAEDSSAKPQGQPTTGFLTEVTTTQAIASDFQGRREVEENQQEHGLGVAEELYVDAGYVNNDVLAEAAEEGRSLMGPARPSCNQSGDLFKADEFDVSVADRKAICPAGQTSTQCSRLEDEKTLEVCYRFEWSYQCDECALKARCTKARSGRRLLVVGEHHDHLQHRRRQMQTAEFKQAMHQRNAIEGRVPSGRASLPEVEVGGRDTEGYPRRRWRTTCTERRSMLSGGFAYCSSRCAKKWRWLCKGTRWVRSSSEIAGLPLTEPYSRSTS